MLSKLKLPLRNVLRNRRRTLVTLITLAIGEIAMLIFGGYSNAVVNGVQTGVVRQAGHLQVQRTNYFMIGTGSPSDYGIAEYKQLMEILRNDPVLKPMLVVVTPLLQVQGIAGNFSEGVSRTVSGNGYIAHDQNQMRQWNEYRFPGEIRKIALPEGEKEVLSIGIGVARGLRLCGQLSVPNCKDVAVRAKDDGPAAPADIAALADAQPAAARKPGVRLDVLTAAVNGAPNVINARVAAAESLGVKEIDDGYLAMPLEMAQHLVYGRTSNPEVTSVILQLQSTTQIEVARQRVNQLIKQHGWDLEVLDYAALFPAYDQIKGLFNSIFGFVSMLIGVVVLFSVANTMSTAVMERTVEIGTLRSMGLRRGGISRQFLTEGLLIGLIGTGVGCVLALLCALGINSAGWTWTPPNSIDKIPLVVHVFNSPNLIAGSVVSLLVLAAISSVLPAYRAARIPVVEALRHV